MFGFYNAGALNTELLAWTNNTTRATTVTLQDGRYCKNGDKTRLWLGSFLTTSTTTTEDSEINRLLFNMYNRVSRPTKKEVNSNIPMALVPKGTGTVAPRILLQIL